MAAKLSSAWAEKIRTAQNDIAVAVTASENPDQHELNATLTLEIVKLKYIVEMLFYAIRNIQNSVADEFEYFLSDDLYEAVDLLWKDHRERKC